jgi:hypothetical protein
MMDGRSSSTASSINLGTVEVGQAGAAAALEEPQFQVFDLAAASNGEGQLVVAGEVPAGSYSNTQYRSTRGRRLDRGQRVRRGHADDAGLQVLGVRVGDRDEGRREKSFAWGFTTSTRYEGCESKGEIAEGRPGAVQLTVHGDHLFYDDLFSEEPMLLFGLIAQADDDGDANGEVSQAELEAVDIRPLANYQVGSTDIVDLWHFIEHQTTTLGHIDGEGHCETIREG